MVLRDIDKCVNFPEHLVVHSIVFIPLVTSNVSFDNPRDISIIKIILAESLLCITLMLIVLVWKQSLNRLMHSIYKSFFLKTSFEVLKLPFRFGIN